MSSSCIVVVKNFVEKLADITNRVPFVLYGVPWYIRFEKNEEPRATKVNIFIGYTGEGVCHASHNITMITRKPRSYYHHSESSGLIKFIGHGEDCLVLPNFVDLSYILDKIKEFMVDGTVAFKISILKIGITNNKVTTDIKAEYKINKDKTITKEFRNFRQNDQFSDVTIQIEDRAFPCHRIILASSSTYFQAMFGTNFSESDSKIVAIKNVDADAFAEILDYVYTGKFSITDENVSKILQASLYLNYPDILDTCSTYVKEHPESNDMIDLCMLGNILEDQFLIQKIAEHICNRLLTYSQDETFFKMPFDIMKNMLEFSVGKYDGDMILALVTKWSQTNPEVNSTKIGELIKAAKLSSISVRAVSKIITKDLDDTVSTKEVSEVIELSDNFCSQNYLQIYGKFIVIENDTQIVNSVKLQRDGRVVLADQFRAADLICLLRTITCSGREYFLSCNASGSLNAFWYYDKGGNRVGLEKPPIAVYRCMFAQMKNLIFLCSTNKPQGSPSYDIRNIANCVGDAKDTCIFVYDYEVNRWFSVPKKKYEVFNPCLAVVDTRLFVIGGYNDGQLDYVQYFDLFSGLWVECTSLPVKLSNAAACAYNGRLYVCGGICCDSETNIFLSYCMESQEWEQLENMKRPAKDHKLILFNKRLYVIEMNPRDSICYYNFQSASWDSTPLPLSFKARKKTLLFSEVIGSVVKGF